VLLYVGEKKEYDAGHIHGAINIPWVNLMEENNPHKLGTLVEMRKVLNDAGVKPTDDIIVYCETSREVSLEYMILKHIMKLLKVRVNEGFWTEYNNYPEHKVETVIGK